MNAAAPIKPFQRLEFNNASGITLAGHLDLPTSGQPLAYALFAHCFTCTKNLKAAANISRALTREDLAVFRFDFTGLGESGGDFSDTNFSSNVEDLIQAARFLESRFEGPRVLIGHSLGGAAVLQAAGAIPSAVAVVTIAAPSNPGHVLKLLKGTREQIESQGAAEVMLAGRKFKLRKQFLDDLAEASMAGSIRRLNRALLVFHAPVDKVVGIENASEIFQAARHPKSFISLDRADHLLSDPADSRYVGSMIAAWARKYLAAAQP